MYIPGVFVSWWGISPKIYIYSFLYENSTKDLIIKFVMFHSFIHRANQILCRIITSYMLRKFQLNPLNGLGGCTKPAAVGGVGSPCLQL